MKISRAGLSWLVALLAAFLFLLLLKMGPGTTSYAVWCVPLAFIILVAERRDAGRMI